MITIFSTFLNPVKLSLQITTEVRNSEPIPAILPHNIPLAIFESSSIEINELQIYFIIIDEDNDRTQDLIIIKLKNSSVRGEPLAALAHLGGVMKRGEGEGIVRTRP